MLIASRVAGMLVLFVTVSAWGQVPAEKKDAPPRWVPLFRADDPSVWDTDAKNDKGEQIAIPLKFVPATIRYLRLRRMDTRESLILPLTRDQLKNGKPLPAGARVPLTTCWWNGTAKDEWKGRHLGIVQFPRYPFPVPHGMIAVMTEGWEGFAGSGFGHKAFVNDDQYYCWRGKEIPRTVFEIAVSDGPLTAEEKGVLLPSP